MSNIREFGAVGDGKADDTLAIQHALADGDGVVEFPRGSYRITRSIVVDLAKHGRTAIDGSGGVAKLIMDGAGPAIFFESHARQDGRPQWISARGMATRANAHR